jgi:hypothetical protein
MSNTVTIDYDDSVLVDPFGRQRVSNPETVFDSKLLYSKQALFWDESLETGSGITSAHAPHEAMVTFTSTEDTAGKFTRQTFMRFNYQSGKGHLIYITGNLLVSGGGTGVQNRIGYFDDENGLFFEYDEGTIKVVYRTNITNAVVDTKVAQSAWNTDKFDGTGPSKHRIYFDNSQTFFIDFEWVGEVRMGLIHDGQLLICHKFRLNNTLNTPFMSTPNLPLRYQMETTSSSPASEMGCICATVISEGGHGPKGGLHYASTDGSSVTCSSENVVYALIGIRLKSGYEGVTINIESISVQIENASKDGEWLWILNPTVADTFTYSDEANSSLQVARGATANTVTNGTRMEGGYAQSTSGGGGSGGISTNIKNAIHLGQAIDGTMDEMVLCWVCRGGTSGAIMEGSIDWRELE